MSILGNPFRPYVKNQVETRQKVLGKQYDISTSDLQYYNSKTPWLRLASSVDIFKESPPISIGSFVIPAIEKLINDSRQDQLNNYGALKKLTDLGFNESDLVGDTLAKKFMLFGGSIDTYNPQINSPSLSPSNPPSFQGLSKGIFNNDTNTIFNSAYGWGRIDTEDKIDDRGFVPMPGITQASVKYLNNGALAETTINIKCWSKKQMALVDVLYLRPGYTLLLEFGWSMYLSDDGQVINYNPGFNSPALDFLFNPTSEDSFYQLYQEIQNHKRETNGNYEGIVGRITKFKWDFNKDGSYNCEVKLMSYGSIIESLKINRSSPFFTKNENYSGVEEFGEDIIKAFGGRGKEIDTDRDRKAAANIRAVASTTLGYLLLDTCKQVIPKYYGVRDNDKYSESVAYKIDNFPSIKTTEEGPIIGYVDLTIPSSFLVTERYQKDESNSPVNFQPNTYITFGTLLAMIQKFILLYDYNNNKNTPLFYFDFDFEDLENSPNFIARVPGQISCNPSSCFIELDEIPEEIKSKLNPNEGYDLTPPNTSISPFIDGDNVFRGKLANIYININVILNNLLKGINNEGSIDVTLKQFLEDIINEIQTCLGGINDIQVIIDNETGAIRFVDRSPILVNDSEEGYTRFRIFGVSPNTEGSFVRELSLNSELSNEYATQMSVGASNGGFSLAGGKTGAFSQYNLGLKDRIIPFREDFSNDSNPQPTISKLIKFWKENEVKEVVENVYDSLQSIKIGSEELNSLTSNLPQFIQLLLKYYEEQTYIPPSSVLPFNLSLELDGISGMRLFEKFYVDDRVLPPTYTEDQVNILIKGIDHTISPTSWVTKLETLYAPNLPKSSKKSLGTDNSQTSPFPPNPTGNENRETERNSFIPGSTFPASTTRRDSMLESFNTVFSTNPETTGLCARYTYNLALNYCKSLKGKTVSSNLVNAGGNANNSVFFWRNLENLGYKKHKIWVNGSRNNLIDEINNLTFGYGDILVYYANDKSYNSTPVKYGHSQIYVGNINNSGWVSSKKENYNSSFVYRTKSNNKWDLLIFRAPGTAESVKGV